MVKTGHGFFQDVPFLTCELEITFEFLDSDFLFGQCGFAFVSENGATFGVVLLLLANPAVQCACLNAEIPGSLFDFAVAFGEFDRIELEYGGECFSCSTHGCLVIVSRCLTVRPSYRVNSRSVTPPKCRTGQGKSEGFGEFETYVLGRWAEDNRNASCNPRGTRHCYGARFAPKDSL
jgi:hypothetical protein